MHKNAIIVIAAVVIILGILIGVKLGGNLTGGSQSNKTVGDQSEKSTVQDIMDPNVTLIPVEPSLTLAPSPTFAPLTETVKSITADKIIIAGTSGDMTIPKDPSKVKVFRQVGADLEAASFDDVQLGQVVTLKIITPGKEAELIISQ